MRLTADEKMMVMLYGNGTKNGTIEALTKMRSSLQEDETALCCLTDGLLRRLQGMTEAEIKEAMDGE